MAAGYVDLDKLWTMCQRGKLATRSLAKLTSFEPLMLVNPEDTTLVEVIINEDEDQIDSVFDTNMPKKFSLNIGSNNGTIIANNNQSNIKVVDGGTMIDNQRGNHTGYYIVVIVCLLFVICFGGVMFWMESRADKQHAQGSAEQF